MRGLCRPCCGTDTPESHVLRSPAVSRQTQGSPRPCCVLTAGARGPHDGYSHVQVPASLTAVRPCCHGAPLKATLCSQQPVPSSCLRLRGHVHLTVATVCHFTEWLTPCERHTRQMALPRSRWESQTGAVRGLDKGRSGKPATGRTAGSSRAGPPGSAGAPRGRPQPRGDSSGRAVKAGSPARRAGSAVSADPELGSPCSGRPREQPRPVPELPGARGRRRADEEGQPCPGHACCPPALTRPPLSWGTRPSVWPLERTLRMILAP